MQYRRVINSVGKKNIKLLEGVETEKEEKGSARDRSQTYRQDVQYTAFREGTIYESCGN